MTRLKMSPLSALVCVASLVCLSACSTGGKLNARADGLDRKTQNMQARALRCAPKELAQAQAQTDFGRYELKQGNFVRAQKHLSQAELNADQADMLSDFDECRGKKVAMVIKATPKAKVVEAKPLPKDRDGDGLLDDVDKCPDKPEDFDKFEDEDGCPEFDNDGDQILDDADKCPDVAEDRDKFEDNDGCPELDNDLDGIADINDQCPLKSEDFDGFQDEDGCDDPDNDSDQIVDILDKCPQEAEDYDGDQDSDGCPEERKLVRMEGGQIKLNQKVFFKTGKANILPVSFPLLDEVAQVLRENGSINIRVEGHTDSRGSNRSNQRLSDRRAASVRKYLESAGVDAGRMTSIGMGEESPIEDNNTEAGRAANRRVEIHITKQ